MKSKRTVYLMDLGTSHNTNFLPLSIGLVGSYAMDSPSLAREYHVHYRFLRDEPVRLIDGLDNPAVVAFAGYIWNHQASLHLARSIKQRFPSALIVFGGYSPPSAPHRIGPYLAANPFIDVIVHGPGEITFARLLECLLGEGDLGQVKGISFRSPDHQQGFCKTPAAEIIQNLEALPSPFLNGVMDGILARYGTGVTGVLWETSRGCPYGCTFCEWGGVDVRKVKRFGDDRLRAELDWISRNQFFYISLADANFGIFAERDLHIAGWLADHCRDTGYPKYLVANWTKNKDKRILGIADRLAEGGIATTINLAMQSTHPETLEAIKRRNISGENLDRLKKEFHVRKVPTYTELILGLPLETYESFAEGVNEILTPRLADHIQIFLLLLLENAELGSDAARREYAFETRQVQSCRSNRKFDETAVAEIEEVVVATSTLSRANGRRPIYFPT